VAAHRASPIPLELRQLPRWTRWQWVRRDEKWTKVPLTVDGAAASSTDPETWARYPAARASSAGAGLGFVLNGDGILCLDLDHCLLDGRLLRDQAALLDTLPATYTEVSPSGDGLHVWLRGTLARDGVSRLHGVRVEQYSRGRYITVTGRPWNGAPSKIATW
jgi:primase-polymerase (primpol)-like protein